MITKEVKSVLAKANCACSVFKKFGGRQSDGRRTALNEALCPNSNREVYYGEFQSRLLKPYGLQVGV